MRILLIAGVAAASLFGCEQKAYVTEKAPPISTAVTPAARPLPPAAPLPKAPSPVPTPRYPVGWAPPASFDTAIMLNGQSYRLLLETETDSTQRLKTRYEPVPGHFDVARGYQGRFTFTLRDGGGRQLFRRQLRKNDFFKVVSEDIVTESEAFMPDMLAYSAPFGALVFTVDFMVPDSDVGSQAVVLLDLTGRVLRMSEGRSPGGGPDCEPTLSADGRSLLTGSELLRPHQPPLRLNRPNADLVGAFLLSDTTLLAVYAPGRAHLIQNPGEPETYGRTPTPQQLRAPNAYVRHVRSGRVLRRFRYGGYYEELGFTIPRHYVPGTATHYLLDEKRGLRLLPLAPPAIPSELRFTAMPRYAPPRKPAEVRFELQGVGSSFAFYVDTTSRVPRIRYQRLEF
jgi:hypothetical protein